MWLPVKDVLKEAQAEALIDNEAMKEAYYTIGPVVNDSLKITGSTSSKFGLYSAVINRII